MQWWVTIKFSVSSRERISIIYNIIHEWPSDDITLPNLSLTLSLSFTTEHIETSCLLHNLHTTGGGGCHYRASHGARCWCWRAGCWRGAAPRAATAGPSMNPGLVSRGHKHSCCRSHTKLLHPQCKESDVWINSRLYLSWWIKNFVPVVSHRHKVDKKILNET